MPASKINKKKTEKTKHANFSKRGLEKSMMHIPHCKAPRTPSILFNFRAHLNLHDSAHLALWCALLVGFFTFFRTANLVPHAFGRFSPQHALSRGSVHFNDSGACLTVTRTKTRQAGDTALVVPLPLIPGSLLCPTTALQLLLRMVPAPDTCPLFTSPFYLEPTPLYYGESPSTTVSSI